MKDHKIPIYARTSGISLSKFQSSAVEKIKEKHSSEKSNLTDSELQNKLLEDPMYMGLQLLVSHFNGETLDLSEKNINAYLPEDTDAKEFHPIIHAYIGKQVYEYSISEAFDKNLSPKEYRNTQFLGFNTDLEGFPYSNYAYESWAWAANVFSDQGDPYPSPYTPPSAASDVDHVFTIPADSKIVIIGDFGTGLDDATDMLYSICKKQAPDFIIHLGDIYYAGTQNECDTYLNTFNRVFDKLGKRIPVFSLPGNHEYMAGGVGYFNNLPKMNSGGYRQERSYFCLRTDDGKFQFLGMDTGYNSVRCSSTNLVKAYAPWLDFAEAEWHIDKINSFNGKTILLSHHQLFSSYAVINDPAYGSYQSSPSEPAKSRLKYMNGNLFNVFHPYLDKIAVWFWGHEHNLMIFEDDQLGLAKGRLIGNSGYEEWSGQNPYTPEPDSPFRQFKKPPPDGTIVKVGTTQVPYSNFWHHTKDYSFLNHGFAILELSRGVISYWDSPITSIKSTGTISEPELNLLYREEISPGSTGNESLVEETKKTKSKKWIYVMVVLAILALLALEFLTDIEILGILLD